MKSQVDSFRPGQQLPSCCLSIDWTGEGNPIGLKHRISLVGAKRPFNFFCIKLMPEIPLTVMEGREIERTSTFQICGFFYLLGIWY